MVGNLPAGLWIGAILVFVAAALGVVVLVLMVEYLRDARRRKTVEKQLDTIFEESFGAKLGDTPSLLRGEDGELPAWLSAVSARVPRIADISHRLQQANLPWSVQGFLVSCVGLGMAIGLALLVLTARMMPALAGVAVGVYLPFAYVNRKRTVRLRAFEEQLPDAADLMGRAIRAGHPLSAGIKMVADEMRDPAASEFRRLFEEQRFGLPFEDALLAMVDRIGSVDTRILATAILIQREVGGNLAEVLDKLSHTIRTRFTFQRQLRVFTAQGRMSGYVLALLPIAVGFAIYLINPEYTMTLFEHPMGRLMVVGAAVLQIIGFLWIRKIVNIDF